MAGPSPGPVDGARLNTLPANVPGMGDCWGGWVIGRARGAVETAEPEIVVQCIQGLVTGKDPFIEGASAPICLHRARIAPA